MAPMTISFFFFLLSMVQAEDFGTQPRSHGLGQESPVPFSPSAFEFFHPNSPLSSVHIPCSESDCAPLPLSTFSSSSAEEARATQVQEATQAAPQPKGPRVGAAGIASIVFGCVLIVFLAMGVYYVLITRQANISRANTVRPDV